MLNYFFYKDYAYNLKVGHADPLLTSAIVISLLESVNLFTAFIFIDSLMLFLTTGVVFAGLILLISILLYVNIRYYKRMAAAICNKYKSETGAKKMLGNVFYIGYLLASFVLLFVLIVVFKR
jgi:hypothetical protein